MARQKSLNPRAILKIRISPEILARLEIEAFVPREFGSPRGLKSQIVEAALKQYFKNKDEERFDFTTWKRLNKEFPQPE